MTYNPPFLYRCEYDDTRTIERYWAFGEVAIEDFYNSRMAEAATLPGARIVIDYYDRRRKRWHPVVRYINKGGETDGTQRQDCFLLPSPGAGGEG